MSLWHWVAASCRGTSHERSGTRLQDAQVCFVRKTTNAEFFISVVSDGAGSATFGGQGASVACRSITSQIKRHFTLNSIFPTEEVIESWIDNTRDLLFRIAQSRDLSVREFACTLIVAISNKDKTVIAHIGDGAAVVKDQSLASWVALSWPDHGEYASTTYFLTDEPIPKLRIKTYINPIEVLVLFTDGIERLALDFLASRPFEKFFDGISAPLTGNVASGCNKPLSLKLKNYLNSSAINSRTDDDKTLIVAATNGKT